MEEKLLQILKENKNPLTTTEINDLLELTTPMELQELEKELDKLVLENKLYLTKKNKYILYDNCPNLKIGKISINKSGNGFLLQKDEDIFIDYSNLNGAVNEDEVLIETFNNQNKTEGKVIKIINRNTKNILGEIILKKDKIFLKLDDKKKKINVEIDKQSAIDCVEGTKVLVNLFKEVSKNNYLGRVVKIIGHKDDPGVDIKVIAAKYNIFEEFSKESQNQIENIPIVVKDEELKNRTDLTEEVIFTIDGDDTKDIDDAISIEKKDGYYILGVHIADVSHYIEINSPLDKDAFKRGTSSYLAYSVIPMLPHKLSNGICSLNPNVLRLTISCKMKINTKGKIIDYEIFPSYIKSFKKMTYKKVNDILMRNIVDEDYKPYVQKLKDMNELAHILRKEKESRGYIDFSIEEPKILCDEEGKCTDVVIVPREDGEKLIEDFMIAANETVASHIYNMDLPFMYRIHEEPKIEKIKEFVSYVSLLGHHVNANLNNISPIKIQNLLLQLKNTNEFSIFSKELLRSMQKAIYSSNNVGHFGLGSSCYTHFTSPIRRYPDLMVHRLLRTYLFENKIDNNTINYWQNHLESIAENCSEREQASVDAEREVDDMKMAEYMHDHIGEIFEARISGVTNFGLFVELPNTIEGLVHINTIEGDYFSFYKEMRALVGHASKRIYKLGDKVKVKLVAANKEEKTIDFVLMDGDKRGNKKQTSKI